MRTFPLPFSIAALTLGLSPFASGQTYDLDLDAPASVMNISGSTNVGPIVGTPPTFQLDGLAGVDIVFGCDGLPAQGTFTGGDVITIPNPIAGQIPGIFGPLATLSIANMHASLESSNFAIAPDGTFTANARLVVLSGTVTFVPFIGDPGMISLAGFVSDFAPTPGQVFLTPTSVRVVTAVDFAIPIDDTGSGVTGQIDLDGTVDGTGPRVATFCDSSDGALSSCPCGNPGAPGAGCDIPQLTGGVQLTVASKRTAPLNRATLTGCGYPTMGSPTSIVIRASAREPSPVVFGDGLRCVGVPLVRLAPSFASSGAVAHVIGHGAVAGAGTFHYQLWFRSTPITYCDVEAAFNLSNGVSLTWP